MYLLQRKEIVNISLHEIDLCLNKTQIAESLLKSLILFGSCTQHVFHQQEEVEDCF